MPSNIIAPPAQAIVNLINGMGSGVTAYLWQPGSTGMDSLPAAVVARPEIRRVPTNERESQIGTRDFYMTYPVVFFFDLEDAPIDEQTAVEVVETFINTVDANMDLSGTVYEASVITSEPVDVLEANASRPLIGYRCEVEVWKLFA